ncbi:NrfD/PsrC family molybdoenzyme membrane anchor subunit [Thioflexithrix psekupsensis]|uniref:Molybdopterin oxidoreductase n=1 Tax=Thioflexithrix psekupsensis TaxID=1570016 RepID=A0A251X7R7_9GAMM|nr:NrfD/PsrC family molybdoenzyme membrane anchor subunit [Thioflexithrix psekupsensis]OUD14098.1 molybdopterin oxidoreductase [Thioflexithrix psekupsensis]
MNPTNKITVYRKLEGQSVGFYILLVVLAIMVAMGLLAAWTMEHEGHWISGMNNQVVWGMPHIFAIFLILAASGVLNVASVSTVFGQEVYKPLGRLSGLLAITLLVGGLMVLVLDLGRPDRLIIAMTHYNFKSIFAWNIVLYNGFMAVVFIYLWFMMEKRMQPYYPIAGRIAFIWRLILTTGTGSIFGFLLAREPYGTAVMAPMFIAMSLMFGKAMFLLILMSSYRGSQRMLNHAVVMRLKNLLAMFIITALYFLTVYFITFAYFTEQHGVVRFFLLDGGHYTTLFWLGQIGLGAALPLFILYHPRLGEQFSMIAVASVSVVIGGMIQLYVLIIGGQAYPLDMFPEMEILASSFHDGVVANYAPSHWEFMLGLAGLAMSLLMTVLAMRIFDVLPECVTEEVPAL